MSNFYERVYNTHDLDLMIINNLPGKNMILYYKCIKCNKSTRLFSVQAPINQYEIDILNEEECLKG
jgi:hypothetical protein